MSTAARPGLFRLYCLNQYWANRDEYQAMGQTQPHTFDEYVRANLTLLRVQWRAARPLRQQR